MAKHEHTCLQCAYLETLLCIIPAETPRPGKAKWLGSLAKERPDLVKEWAQNLNGDVTPESTPAGSNFTAAWRCEKGCKDCGRAHEWHTGVADRCLRGTSCPICAGNRVCPCQSLAAKHKGLMDEWDCEANQGIDPESLACLSNMGVAWRCQQCGHTWSARINHRVHQRSGCPSCARENRVQSKRGLLKDERPDIFAEIHPSMNAGVNVSSLTCGSRQELWWLCTNNDGRPDGCQCEHAWKAKVCNRCQPKCPTGCPYHSGLAVCPCNSIAGLHPDLVDKYWCFEMNEGLDAEAIGAGSGQRVWWVHLCVDGRMHRQQLRINNVVCQFKKSSRISCRICANKERSAPYPKRHSRLIDRD